MTVTATQTLRHKGEGTISRRPPSGGSAEVGAIVLKDIVKDYPTADGGSIRAVGPVSFSIEPGRLVAVVGPSGCGKTTILKLLARMIEPSSGAITSGLAVAEAPRVGMVFQSASLFPWRTLVDNVCFGLELKAHRSRAASRGEREAIARRFLKLVGLEAFHEYYPHQVSGGMQQRVNLARALAIDPALLLMDEPFSALDAQTREELQVELQRIAVEAAPSTVFVTHDIREAVFLADQVVVLSKRPGTVQAVFDVPTPRPRPLHFQMEEEFIATMRKVWNLVHPGRSTRTIE